MVPETAISRFSKRSIVEDRYYRIHSHWVRSAVFHSSLRELRIALHFSYVLRASFSTLSTVIDSRIAALKLEIAALEYRSNFSIA